MPYNISKELFEAVMGFSVESVYLDNSYVDDFASPEFVWSNNGEQIAGISVDTFFFKCKEWAYPYGYTILSSTDECSLIDREGIGLVFEQHYVHEAQAVFNACQWILENK